MVLNKNVLWLYVKKYCICIVKLVKLLIMKINRMFIRCIQHIYTSINEHKLTVSITLYFILTNIYCNMSPNVGTGFRVMHIVMLPTWLFTIFTPRIFVSLNFHGAFVITTIKLFFVAECESETCEITSSNQKRKPGRPKKCIPSKSAAMTGTNSGSPTLIHIQMAVQCCKRVSCKFCLLYMHVQHFLLRQMAIHNYL